MYIHVHIYEQSSRWSASKPKTYCAFHDDARRFKRAKRAKQRERKERKQTKIAKKSKCRRIVHTSELSGKQFSFVS